VDEMLVDLKGLLKELESGTKKHETIKPIPKSKNKIVLFGIIAGLFLIVLISFYFIFLNKTQPIERKSIAVLPFQNLSEDKTNEYFSDGITEDVITHLSKIRDLKVISRTSIMLYKDSRKSLREIGRELGVATILEGSVRRADNRVRIVSQLIDAKNDEHLWAETYDREMRDIFSIQSDVAQKIAHALEAKLSSDEMERIEQIPTENLEAYDYYLKAREYDERSRGENDLVIAIDLYERAITKDPDFAEAYAGMAHTYLKIYWFGYDQTQERLSNAKELLDKALNLNPDKAVVRAAKGFYYYYGFRDYNKALDEFSYALRKEPGNADYLSNIAYVQRRLGQFKEALENFKIAFQYNPRSSLIAEDIGSIYISLRIYKEVEGYIDRAMSLAPDNEIHYLFKAWGNIYETGKTIVARETLEEALIHVQSADLPWFLAFFDIYDRAYSEALERLVSIKEDVFENQFIVRPKESILGFIYAQLGQLEKARIHISNSRIYLENKAEERPDDARIHAELGKVYGGLGLKDKAISEGRTAVDLIPVSQDALIGPVFEADLAEIYTIVGEYEAAIDKLEYLMEIPAGLFGMHHGVLKVNPVWDPLRDHPRFQKLLEGTK
jgi:serine/threonine-protein kinase